MDCNTRSKTIAQIILSIKAARSSHRRRSLIPSLISSLHTRLIASLIAICLVFFIGLSAFAFSPTPEQIEKFKSLPPAEQQRLAASMGVDLPIASPTPIQRFETPTTVTPRNPQPVSQTRPKPAQTPNLAGPIDLRINGKNKEIVQNWERNNQDQSSADREQPLQPFGYDLFAGSPSTFAPVTDIPVPVNYSIGPGDIIVLQLYGKENSINELIVSREGMVQFPEIGPISVNGLNYGELKTRVDQLVSEQMIGVKASVTMGGLRSIRVFVLGEAYRPGSYTVSSLSTMTNALFASGGIKPIGSLRNIQLKRNGKVITTLDLYDLLMNGDTSGDKRLQPGDVLFIPTIEKTVAVSGEVRRPAIYEIKNEKTLGDVVDLAGGYKPDAFPGAARIERVNNAGNRTVLDVNLVSSAGKTMTLMDGDALDIPSVLDKLESVVRVSGHVHRPGYFTYSEGLKANDVIDEISDLKANPDLTIALVKREVGEARRTEFVEFNLGAAIRGDQLANITLQPRDEIIVFPAGNENRKQFIYQHIDDLKDQFSGDGYAPVIKVVGEVQSPGEYPLTQNMTISDALQLSGYLTSNADRNAILLMQIDALSNAPSFQLIEIGSAMMQDRLQARDEIVVLPKTGSREELLVPLVNTIKSFSQYGIPAPLINISGAVKFPGDYPLYENATVGSLVAMAGGLREEAYKLTGELSRVDTTDAEDSFQVSHKIIELDTPEGQLVPLKSRDRLIIKKVPEWGESIQVTLNGEVRFPGQYPVKKGETVSDLIARAGGLTEQADPKGAIFLRESLKEKEQKMLARFKKQIEEEAASVAQTKVETDLDSVQFAELEGVKQNLLDQIEDTEAQGRLVFDLPSILEDEKDSTDVVLKDGDSITVPPFIQEVSVLGEVYFPTSHLYEKGLNAGKYVRKSGGVTNKADKKNAYVIGRDGAVRPMYKWKFLFLGQKRKLQPGDTLVVPTDIDRMHPLTVWQKTSQILFQLATTAAALNTVGAI